MLLCAVVFLAIAFLLWYLKSEVNLERSFTIISTVSWKDVFIFLSAPSNLEKSHPTIYKVSDIQTEKDSVKFYIEEDLGGLLGRNRLSMKITSSSENLTSSSHIWIDTYSSVANVSVTLTISDYNTSHAACQASRTGSGDLPSAVIQAHVSVKTWRVLSRFIAGHVLRIWDKTIRKTVDILGGQSDLVS